MLLVIVSLKKAYMIVKQMTRTTRWFQSNQSILYLTNYYKFVTYKIIARVSCVES